MNEQTTALEILYAYGWPNLRKTKVGVMLPDGKIFTADEAREIVTTARLSVQPTEKEPKR